uniref:Putative reverse transcriptase and intron maturase n=1 Tax=Chlorokybus atmophyticus TaxID=3144 RepID=A6YE98_CHLAT|nr:putative reverse transcriptase and intron maturase [Chlorokybus atmophyticus]ABO15138.1 putative reverse transcriptase and intron maturase [Chlorokybus atmophyticus]
MLLTVAAKWTWLTPSLAITGATAEWITTACHEKESLDLISLKISPDHSFELELNGNRKREVGADKPVVHYRSICKNKYTVSPQGPDAIKTSRTLTILGTPVQYEPKNQTLNSNFTRREAIKRNCTKPHQQRWINEKYRFPSGHLILPLSVKFLPLGGSFLPGCSGSLFVKEYGVTTHGGTGETRKDMGYFVWQRAHSTRLLERDLVRGKRLFTSTVVGKEAEGKGPKSMDVKKDIAYSNRVQKGKVLSDDTIDTRYNFKVESIVRTTQITDRNSGYRSTYAERLHTLWKLSSSPHFQPSGLWKLVRDINLWIAAYKKLAPNPGSLTKSGAGGKIDGTSLKSLEWLRDRVSEGKFQFGRSEKVYTLKPKVGNGIPLDIPEFQDRLVQEVVRTILEVLYEPQFLESSHGFRPNKSQHTAMVDVRQKFKGVVWCIKGDISKSFDTIDKKKLITQMRKKVKDEKFCHLIYKGLKSRLLMPEGIMEVLKKGISQKGICSPLLCNIALHQLDLFIERLKKIVNKVDSSHIVSQPYQSQMVPQRERAAIGTGDWRGAIKAIKMARKMGYGDHQDPNLRRLTYVRYADDFLIGVTGPKKLAERIGELVSRFLKIRLNLTLNQEKIVISKLSGKKIPFLGFQIYQPPLKEFTSTQKVGKQNTSFAKMRKIEQVRYGDIHIYADTQYVINHLAEQGFCDKRGFSKPNFRYYQDPQSFTVNKIRSILHRIDNYYTICKNRRRFISRIMKILRGSICKTFAAKYKLKSQRAVYKIAGKDLSNPIKPPNKTKTVAALHCTALHCTALHCTALHCTALHCTALHCTALHCTALHCTALHCTALHCTALHCTALHEWRLR